MPISAQAAFERGARLKPFSYEPGPLAPHEIELRVTHCGICHSDIHLIDNDWGVSAYPLVPGHEAVGLVTALGSHVAHLKKGDRVGIGWQCGACLHCEECVHGRENYCPGKSATCVGHHGGFADALRCDSRFAFKIPDTLPSAGTAPMLCGGLTVFSPLKRFGVKPGQRVAVVGIGGLGHMALRFARAFGCEVTAFSHSPDKEAEAKTLGAHHFHDGSNLDRLRLGKSFDMILSTVFSDLDWQAYLRTLRTDGTLCLLGVPPSALEIPAIFLMDGRRRITSSSIGSRSDAADMLDFAALHGITAQVETVPFESVNEALDKVRANKARYRMVLQRD